MAKKKPWWSSGLRFECQGSGKCCVSRGEHGYVYMTPDDRKAMAKALKLTRAAFDKKYCQKSAGGWSLRDREGDCVFLDGRQCAVYEARPVQCRTWPFWPENMNAKAWKKDVAEFCPGVGEGRIWSEAEIRAQLAIQAEAEDNP